MTEFIVKNVAFNYSPVEDRVGLKCVTEESTHQLWLTQRMLHQLLPALTKWLVDAGFGTSQTKSFMASSLKSSQQNSAVKSKVDGSADAGTASAQSHDNALDRIETQRELRQKDAVTWVCTKANLSFDKQRIRMKWESEASTDSYIFSMTSIEASHFLIVLRDSIKNADWSCHWPEWLPLIEEDLPSNTAFLH
ncbi:hypothetical protein ACPUEK_05900 [Marinomonas gallaica]|uniref:hypothetical protein n=1 Tax=Marinomonas gallaica TaxID=1806667 RepID=UPI003CE4856A